MTFTFRQGGGLELPGSERSRLPPRGLGVCGLDCTQPVAVLGRRPAPHAWQEEGSVVQWRTAEPAARPGGVEKGVLLAADPEVAEVAGPSAWGCANPWRADDWAWSPVLSQLHTEAQSSPRAPDTWGPHEARACSGVPAQVTARA